MYEIERQEETKRILRDAGKVTVADLSIKFSVTKETIRKDLQKLADEGYLRRTHGGAVLSEGLMSEKEYSVEVRGMHHVEEKKQLCKKACTFLQDKDVIFIDNSSTTLFMLDYIPRDMHITIITNSINLLLMAASKNVGYQIICMGGKFKSSNLSVFGGMTVENAGHFYPNKAFLSCAGVNLAQMFVADGSMDEVETKRIMVQRSQLVYLLADYSKLYKNGQVFLANMDDIDYWVINKGGKMDGQLEKLQSTKIKLIEVD